MKNSLIPIEVCKGVPIELFDAQRQLFSQLIFHSGVPEQYSGQDLFNYCADFLLRWKDQNPGPKTETQFAPFFDSKSRFTNLPIDQYQVTVSHCLNLNIQKPPYQLQSRKILDGKDFGSYIDLRAFQTETHQISRSLQQKNHLQKVRERQIANMQMEKMQKQRSKQYQNLMNEDIQLISSLPEDKKEELTLESPFQAGIVEQQSHNEIKIEQGNMSLQTNDQNTALAEQQQQA